MAFGLMNLLHLKLKRQTVPQYSNLLKMKFPQKIPIILILLCFLNSILKLSIPLILEQTYSQLSNDNNHNTYIILIIIVMIALGISQIVLIGYNLMLSLYRLNVKKQLSSRIINTNFSQYKKLLQSHRIDDRPKHYSMDLWIKIMTKLSVYLHNYYQSILSFIFQCFNIFFIIIYLCYKLSFALFFGLAIAGLVIYKTLKITNQMQDVRFNNIELRSRRLKILESYFEKITQFKMTWLDKWIYDRVTMVQHLFQEGLREIKMLDCWCVALWQFTGVGISGIVIIAYYMLGLSQKDGSSVFTPSTFIYMLNMLNFPLNALSWYIAGIKTANRAISQISSDIIIHEQSQNPTQQSIIQQYNNSFYIRSQIKLTIEHENNRKQLTIPLKQFKKNKIYTVKGQHAQHFLSKFIFLFNSKVSKSYVQQNGWLPQQSLGAFQMNCKILNEQTNSAQINSQIKYLMQLFQCKDIPLQTNTKNYSGGQKLRINLVRAFNLGQIIIINTNLNSLDIKMKQKIKAHLYNLANHRYPDIKKKYTIFIRDNDDIADQQIEVAEKKDGSLLLKYNINTSKKTNQDEYTMNSSEITVSDQIVKYLKIHQDMKQRQNQTLKRKEDLKLSNNSQSQQKQKEIVNLQTFKLYYKSKKHILFLLSLIFVTLISNYYNYYLNTYIKFNQCTQDQIEVIIIITILFAFGLFFRSYLFADANLEQSKRICHDLNRNIIMQQLQFYQSQNTTKEKTQQKNSKSRLICALSTDTEMIADHFPFSTNIFANNITTILSAIIIIMIEVPQILILMVFLVIYANRLNNVSRKKDEILKMALKQKEQDLYKIISQIEQGKKYVIIHNKFQSFYSSFERTRDQYIAIEWQSQKYKNYINFKYKMVMMLFLAIGIVLYSFFNVIVVDQLEISANKPKRSSGLALLIQYTIQLSNYLLYFTMSLWEIKGQALSIERIKDYLQPNQDIEDRFNSSNKILSKINNVNKKSLLKGQKMVQINELNFSYKQNPHNVIFHRLNLSIAKGDSIIIRGKSGGGKTTLYKLMTSAYPKIFNLIDAPFNISYSPQHPLLLPDTASVQENINPYKIVYTSKEIEKVKQQFGLNSKQNVYDLDSEQQLVINNIRAYLYSDEGLTIYDEPKYVFQREDCTSLIVTHHHEFKNTAQFILQNGELNQSHSHL